MRKKKTIVEETIPDETLDDVPEVALSEITDHYKLYKLNGASKAFCYQSREPIDEAMIQDQYPMGGKFIVYSFTVDKVVLTTEQCEIEPKPLNLNTTPQHNGNTNAAEIQVRMLLDELKFSRDMILTMLNKNSSEHTPITELVGALQGLRELSPSAKDPIDLLVKGMEMASKFNGGGSESWKDVIATTAKDLIGPALNAYGAMKQNPPTVSYPNAPVQIEEQSMLPDMFIKQGLKWLKSRIIAGMEPLTAVNWLISANDPMFEPFITKALNGSIQTFIDIDNEIANEPYRGWFTESITLLKEAYAARETNDEDSSDYDGGNGDDSNIADDAIPSPRRAKIAKAM